MSDVVHSLIVGAAAGAVLASGFGTRTVVASTVVFAIINAILANRSRR